MTVLELCKAADLKILSLPNPDREVCGAYIGDLLSWVMGRAKEDNAWLTIMSNINVIAVASLADVSCVILCEGVSLDDETTATAKEKGINILLSKENSYQTAVKISGMV